MKKISILIAAVLLTAFAYAQAPQKLSYQAVVRNAGGALVTSSPVGIRISILQGSSVGSAVYVETHSASTNSNGLVTIELGGGTPVTGTFSAINWAAGTYYLKTETDPTGGTTYTISGTSQLLSVPYALYAGSSGNSTSGSGSTGYIPKWTATTSLGNSGLYDDGTGIGLGMTSLTHKFSVLQSGVNGAGYFKNSNTTPTFSTLYGEANNTTASTLIAGVEGKSVNGFGVIGRGGSASVGIYGINSTSSPGAFFSGSGVSGFSDVGSGVGGITYSGSHYGVNGSANGTGVGVRGFSTLGKAGFFEITNTANTSNALEATTAGTGAGMLGSNSAATGLTIGVRGTSASTSHGTGATGGATGVQGEVTPTVPGGYSAGVRGINNGTTGTGIGTVGYQNGSGWGVYGETPSGFGVYGLSTNNSAANVGVRGETFSPNGIAVEAKYSGTGVGIALELDNGPIRVAGVNKAAFIHTATPANKLDANGTDIDNPLCNGDPNCFLFVTQRLNPSGIVYNNAPVGVYYNTTRSKWEIFNENNVAIPNNAQFNVFVVKQ